MARPKIWLISLFLIIIDALLVGFSFWLATIIRKFLAFPFDLAPVSWDTVISMGELGIIFIVAIFFFQNLYPGYGLTAVKELEQMSKATCMAFILLTTLSYLNKAYLIFPRSIILLAWFICLFLIPIIRFIARNILSRTNLYGIPVIVFGDSSWALEVIASLNRVRRLGWKPISSQPVSTYSKAPKNHQKSIAILAFDHGVPLSQKIRDFSQVFHKVVVVEESNNYGSLWVEIRDLDSFMGLEYKYHLLSRMNHFVKKAIDFIGALILLIFLSPLLLITCLLVKLDSEGPVFYRQERLGRDFKKINVIKFRSMVPDADQRLEDLLKKDANAREKFKKYHKLEKDPRITRVGRFIRRFSIDEFPQLVNVLKGDMSLSGPRAYLPSELEEMGSYAATILRVRPGMTGWWQVLGRHSTSFQKRLQMDEYYISNWSIWMDVYIYLKTVGVVFKGKGA